MSFRDFGQMENISSHSLVGDMGFFGIEKYAPLDRDRSHAETR